ncbi:MAG: hypothetical protein SF066_17885 [Thermoanaerobaculia bacterium]|nr:hypothetical protein [Thermoanaerobaculia bacterium]
MFLEDLLHVLRAFEEQELEYVLIGAAAMNLHGILRATEDADVFIRGTEDNVERLKRALRSAYDDPSIDEISSEDLLGDYPSVRYLPPDTEFFLDILVRLGEFARYEDLEWREVEFEGVRVRLATPETLHWLKKGTVRPQDRVDAEAIRWKFDLPPTND